MMRKTHWATLLSAAVSVGSALVVVPSSAFATPKVALAKTVADGHVLKDNRVPAGAQERYGHAEVLVHAPLADVRKTVTNYANYKTIAPHRLKQSRVVKRHKDGKTDVYFKVEAVRGLFSFYTLTRFDPPKRQADGSEVIEGRQVEGDVKEVHIVWHLLPVSERETLLICDANLRPDFPTPDDMLDEELRDSAGHAAWAMRVRTEEKQRPKAAEAKRSP